MADPHAKRNSTEGASKRDSQAVESSTSEGFVDRTKDATFLEKTSAASRTLGNAGNYMFDTEEERERHLAEERLEAGSVATFAQSKAHTPIDGLAKGVAALGTGLGRGLLGVFTEPVKGASEGGAGGFFSGLGKGLVGLVTKPAAGVIELGVKTTEGIVNTPSTLNSLVSGNPYEGKCFGAELSKSLSLAKGANQRHLLVKCLDELEHSGLDKKHVWDAAVPVVGVDGSVISRTFVHSSASTSYAPTSTAALVYKLRDLFDEGKDVNLEAIEPVVLANLLRLYLVSLPTPLITPTVYEQLMAHATLHFSTNTTKDPSSPATSPKNAASSSSATSPVSPSNSDDLDSSVKKIRAVLTQLPDENKAALSELCVVLRKFLKASSRNGLDLSSLSSSLALCLLRPPTYSFHLEINPTTTHVKNIPNYSLENDVLPILSNFYASPQLDASLRRSLLFITKTIISHYQPGYLTYNLYE